MATSEADHSSTGSDEQVATLYACLHAKLPDLLYQLCVCLCLNFPILGADAAGELLLAF